MPADTVLMLLGQPAAVGEKKMITLALHKFSQQILYATLHSLPTTVRFLLLPEGVLMLDTLH